MQRAACMIIQNPRGFMRLFFFPTAVKTRLLLLSFTRVCFDSWMDTQRQYSRAKKLNHNPGVAEASQLFFLAYSNTG